METVNLNQSISELIVNRINQTLIISNIAKLVVREVPTIKTIETIPATSFPFLVQTSKINSSEEYGHLQEKIFISKLDCKFGWFGIVQGRLGFLDGDADRQMNLIVSDLFKIVMSNAEWDGLAKNTEIKEYGDRLYMFPYFSFSLTVSIEFFHKIHNL